MKSIIPLLAASALAYETFLSGETDVLGWTDVNFDWNGDDQWLPDHDHIVLTKNCADAGVPAGYVRFGLVEAGTWWKALNQFHGDHWDYEIVAVQDCPGVIKYADYPVEFLSLYNLVLSKAKTFGVHTNMYKLNNTD